MVFSAILGQEETIPTVQNPDPRLTYLLYTDGVVTEAPPPWQPRIIPSIFRDAVRDSKRLKLMPHLFLPDYDVSVWVDATCDILDLTADRANALLGDGYIALLRHPFTSCLYEEAKTVMQLGLDADARIARQILAYRAEGVPQGIGLYAAGFMIRRHNDAACRRFDRLWWEQVILHSRRDQLSAPYVNWLLGANVTLMPLHLTDNSVFRWHPMRGARPGERRTRPRPEALGSAFRSVQGEPPSDSTYQTLFDIWPPEFIRHLHSLNARISRSEGPLVGSPLYPDGERHFQFAPPDPRLGLEREVFLRANADRTSLLQIGFSAGHAALLALAHTNARVTSVAFKRNPRNRAAAKYLRQAFPERFRILWPDADRSEPVGLEDFDAVHISRAVSQQACDAVLETVVQKANQSTVVVVERPATLDEPGTPRTSAPTGQLSLLDDLQVAGAAAFIVS